MTNEQIIADIAVRIWGKDTVEDMLIQGGIPLHTARGWASLDPAFRIKKGEHGIATRLWKKRRRKNISTDENEVQQGSTPNNSEYYLAKAYLFRGDQVVKEEVNT